MKRCWGVLAFALIFFPGYIYATPDSILHRRWVMFLGMAGVWGGDGSAVYLA